MAYNRSKVPAGSGVGSSILTSWSATANVIESSQALSNAPANIPHQAALGLRLRVTDGLETITTVTHAFL